MVEKDLIIKEKVENTGVFDFGAFYSFSHTWLVDEGYQVIEEKYAESVSGEKRNITAEWKAYKSLSEYFKVEIFIRFVILGMSDVEVQIDGKNKKMNKGNLSIELKGTLITDPESNWETSPTWRFMKGFYNKYIIPKRLDDTKLRVTTETRTLKEQMKAYLELVGRR